MKSCALRPKAHLVEVASIALKLVVAVDMARIALIESPWIIPENYPLQIVPVVDIASIALKQVCTITSSCSTAYAQWTN